MIVKAGLAVSALALGALTSGWAPLSHDPRGTAAVNALVMRREADDFRDQLRRGNEQVFAWPGLSAAQVSWTWLQVLSGLHNPAGYEGDFSWMFSKLDAIVKVSRPEEIYFLTSLAPFYFVIGHDYAGATLIMNELLRRSPPSNWRAWFWSSFHAMDNLGDKRMAGNLLATAARNPATPPYFAALSLRLTNGDSAVSDPQKREMLERDLDPVLLEKLKQSRPEWFRE